MRFLLAVSLVTAAGCAPSVVSRAAQIPYEQGTYIPTRGDSMARPLSELFSRAANWGFSIEPMAPGDASFGRVIRLQRRMYLRHDMPVNALFETLIHEMAHVFAPWHLNDSQDELFAELVLVEVARYYGHRCEDTSARYLARHKTALPLARSLRREVKRAADIITGRHPYPGR
jgi:hypothetical protein